MRKKLLFAVVLCIAIVLISCASVNAMTIVLDPGHGGVKPQNTEAIGCENGNLKEREITLKIGLYLRDILNQYKDVNVIMTRTDDSALTIWDRAMIARNNKADLFVSLHINDASDVSSNGVEVWVTAENCLEKYNAMMTELGNKIIKNITDLGIANRGVKTKQRTDPMEIYSTGKQADYYGVICYAMRGTKIDKLDEKGNIDYENGSYYNYIVDSNGKNIIVDPSYAARVENGEGISTILIEHAFIHADSAYLDSDEDLKKLAEADGKAIVEQYNLQLKSASQPDQEPAIEPEIIDAETPVLNKDKIVYTDENVQALEFVLQNKNDRVTRADLKLAFKEYNTTSDEFTKNFVTGDKVKIGDKQYEIVIYGDVNCDGIINILDASKIVASIKNGTSLSTAQYIASNVNNDSASNILDASKIVTVISGKKEYTQLVNIK